MRPWEVALVLWVLCISGDPLALSLAGRETTWGATATFLALMLLIRRGAMAIRAFAPIGAVFAVLAIVHFYAFAFFPIVTELGFLTRLFIGMAVVVAVSDFVRTYVAVMLGLSLLSFVFWIPEYIGLHFAIRFHMIFAGLERWLGPQANPDQWSLGFHSYTVIPGHMHRNAGIFWEPGAFAGYLIIGLLLLAAIQATLTRKQHARAFGVLTIALLSTFSTAGYLAYPIALFLNYGWRRLNTGRPSAVFICIAAPLVILGSLFAFTELDFLHTKIGKQISDVEHQEGTWRTNRIGTLVFDWKFIAQRPLTGWGINQKTRFAWRPQAAKESNKMGNGMSDFIATFGAIGFGVFLFGLSRGAYQIGGRSLVYAWGVTASILVVLQGEPFLNFPLFLGLMFLPHSFVGVKLAGSHLVPSRPPILVSCRS